MAASSMVVVVVQDGERARTERERIYIAKFSYFTTGKLQYIHRRLSQVEKAW